jgi:hypothetical protein
MTKRSKKPPRWLLPGVAIVCVGLSLWAFYVAYGEWRISRADVKTSCTVVAARRENSTEDSQTSRAVVTIAHELDGKRYERTDVSGWSRDEQITSDLTDYRVNTQVACRYVRGHPEIVVALWRRGETPMLYLFGGIVLLLVPAIAYAIARRKKNARRAG